MCWQETDKLLYRRRTEVNELRRYEEEVSGFSLQPEQFVEAARDPAQAKGRGRGWPAEWRGAGGRPGIARPFVAQITNARRPITRETHIKSIKAAGVALMRLSRVVGRAVSCVSAGQDISPRILGDP
ncbi:hypothetical protein J6590_063598 [Homalodisca vitripennis]|nr:hypothetical protein J6590_063598 [Homalodisca vitripennis]